MCARVILPALLVVGFVFLVNAADVTTLEYDEPFPVIGTRQNRDKDESASSEQRQGRISMHSEVPSSKAERDQALRKILTARRRQILNQRVSVELPRSSTSRSPKQEESTLKDSSDILEAEETKHAMYVTASANTRSTSEEMASEVSTRTLGKSDPNLMGVDVELTGNEPDSKQVTEQTLRKANDENFAMSSTTEGKPASGNSRSNYSIGHRNSSSSSTHSTATSPSFIGSVQKPTEPETRKKNTVAMPESLYNYFRPVESNIPVEDMSQFLYFGQKIQPESNNGTNNNTVEVTPTSPPLPSSRRRYSMKRFSMVTPATVSKLEDMMNEEMNIAMEKQIVEKNKVPKLKNTFRSPDSGLYYRKVRPTEATIVSNVISSKEQGRNVTEIDTNATTELVDDKFHGDNSSAHAAIEDQLQHTSERGSSAAHVAAEIRNATNSTQIPRRQLVSVNMHEESTTESEISWKDHPTDITSKSPLAANAVTGAKMTKSGFRRRKMDNASFGGDASSSVMLSSRNLKNDSARNGFQVSGISGTEMHGDYSEQKIRRADDFEENDSVVYPKDKNEMQMDQAHPLGTRESNNIETSTLREKLSRSSSGSPYSMGWMSLAGRSETSTLRIIVTEENYKRSSPILSEPNERNTVKLVDSTVEGVRTPASGGILTVKSPGSARITIEAGSEVMNKSSNWQEPQEQQQNQQQHVYAYTITNVTRLLRNYTGPGLSIKEQEGPERSTGTAEITTGSPERPQPPPPPSLLLLPRAGSGIEASRAPAELSAGTTVEPATVSGVSTGTSQEGERPRKVVAVVPQQRAPSRASSSVHLNVNKSGSRTSRPTEAAIRGTVRWNHTKTRNSDLEVFGDRRLLRKSASAVLNQRIGGTNPDEDISLTPSKRRRVPNGQTLLLSAGRRVKGQGLNKSLTKVAMGTSNRTTSFVDTTVEEDKKGDVDGKKAQDAVASNPEEAIIPGESHQPSKTVVPENQMMEKNTTEQYESNSNVSNFTEAMIENPSTRVTPNATIEEEASNLTEATTSLGDNLASDTKDQSVVIKSNESSRAAMNTEASNWSGVTSTDNPSSSLIVTVTDAADERPAAKETTESSKTTVSTPVFPDTPKTLTEAGRVPIEKETFTLKPTEPAVQVTGTKTTEQSRPLSPVNLEPAEIQKMYRSKNVTTTPQPPVTIPKTETSEDKSTARSFSEEEPFTSSNLDPRRRGSERSPEVRARNLSDKTKDKDDVLPIMQLYNTSNMFNGSAPMDAFSRGTGRQPVELPVSGESTVKPHEASRTTEKSSDSKNSTRNPSSSTPASPARVPELKEVSTTQANSRREKSEENRETSTQVPPTGPGRGSSFVNGSASNRTRHRPVYNPSVLPEYNSSGYPVDLNRTFFDAGLISVSPRESVNISEVISKRHDSDAIASQETVAVVSYILATLVVFPIAVGVGLILRRLILRNRKVLEESDTSSEISCRKDALNLENGDFKTSIEKAITKLPRIQHLCHEAEKPPPPSAAESRWEFPRDKLRLQTVLGQGNFGQVWKAEADDLTGHQGTTRLVAVKTVKEGASDREKEDLVRELEIMQQLGSHPNVVTLLGCCTEQEPHYLILEYVMYGKLLAYLRDHRTRQDFYNFSEDSAALTSRDLTVFGYCVARGMEYLASKKIIHRDLAARNVLVDHNKLCKIADFGMSRFANEDGEVIETRHGRNALPIRWMAPESLIYSLFTTKTDVWSFGILMWEIVTLGSTPYPDMTAREVMRNVQNGYRLERPSHCRSELFRVISRCWHADPDRRPEFQTLRRDMAQLLEDNMNGHYVDLESFASECTD